MFAQLGFCQGNSGNPIFEETFGAGLSDSPLPPNTTSYIYANGQAPNDGFYTVSSNSEYFDWFAISDHTLNDTNGRMLIVNSDFTPGEFYKTNISGLCENTTYEFSSWLINLSPAGGFCSPDVIPINVKFEIWDNTDTNLLASGNTGNILSSATPNWEQYALVFQTVPGQTSIILKMKNNGAGGCGNDLAIDDIIFKSCGDSIAVEDSTNTNTTSICSTQAPFNDTITAIPDNTVFASHFYQWQISNDGAIWSDITGETDPSISVIGITQTTYYRAKVSEFQANLNNSDCITFTDVYEITITQAPSQPTTQCWETATFDDTVCDWVITGIQPAQPTDLECWETITFNDITCTWDRMGIQPAQPTLECWQTTIFNNTSCIWEIAGSQPAQPTGLECWETSTFNNISCDWEISGTQPDAPINLLCWQSTLFNEDSCSWDVIGAQPLEFREEFVKICKDETIRLEANSFIDNPTYRWSTGEESYSIEINNAGVYEVEVTDNCFTEIITFTVTEISPPIIESIVTDGSSIIVNLTTEGNYQYSIDSINYQSSNVFSNQPSKLYTIIVRSVECNFMATQTHLHFFIPKFMTPNGDGDNDFFSINALRYFNSTKVSIFDRYGKLLFSAVNRNINWNGTFNNADLPPSDYWYLIEIDGEQFRGHFTLKR